MLDVTTNQEVGGRLACVPNQVQKLNDELVILRQQIATHGEILSLHSGLSAAIAAKSTLGALAFTNRSIERLNGLMDKREHEADWQAK